MMLSVIMPTYQTEKIEISKAIKSVMNQSFLDWELIIVDDNKKNSEFKENTRVLQKKYVSEKRIKFIICEDNNGANHARNIGVKNSIGEYIAFLDSDDIWDNDYLEKVQEKISYDRPDLIATDYRVIKEHRIAEIHPSRPKASDLYSTLILHDCIGPTSAVVVKKSSLIGAGLFDETMPARQDYDTWLRIVRNGGRSSFINECKVSIVRKGGASVTTRGMNHIYGTEKVLQKLLSYPELAPYYNKIKAAHYYESAHFALSQGNLKIAKKYYKRALSEEKNIKAYFGLLLSDNNWLYNIIRIIYRKHN